MDAGRHPVDPQLIQLNLRLELGDRPAPGMKAMVRPLAEADLRDVLRLIDVPTLLLYGDKDVRLPFEYRPSSPRAYSHV
jgi:pimeloyl-ACP methyl ester carboxylesterase